VSWYIRTYIHKYIGLPKVWPSASIAWNCISSPDRAQCFCSSSLTSPLLWHNYIGFPSTPAWNLKFFSLFLILSLNSILLLNVFVITPDPYLCPLWSSHRHDLCFPRVRTAMAQTRSFASIGPSLWNCLPPLLRYSILSAPLSSSRLMMFTQLNGLLNLIMPSKLTSRMTIFLFWQSRTPALSRDMLLPI